MLTEILSQVEVNEQLAIVVPALMIIGYALNLHSREFIPRIVEKPLYINVLANIFVDFALIPWYNYTKE